MTDRSGIICAGNWIVDLVHDIDGWPGESDLVRIGLQTRGMGGGAANVIAALSRLETGLPLWPMGAIGDDQQGQFVLDECGRLGLDISQIKIKPDVATAHTHVMSVAGQSRTFFYQGGANDVLGAADFPVGTFSETPARIFYLGYLSLLATLDDVAADGTTQASLVLERAKAAGMTTAIDLVSIHHPHFQAVVGAAAPFVDYLVANELEAARATGSSVPPEAANDADTLVSLAKALVAQGVNQAVVLHCTERVVWVNAGGETLVVEVPAVPPEEIASNLGAGDAFCAGLLYGIHSGFAPAKSIELATKVAAASLKGLTATSAIPRLSEIDLSV